MKIKSFSVFRSEEKQAQEIIVRLKNDPPGSKAQLIINECLFLTESKSKVWGQGYEYRIDNRAQNMGGKQIHIWNASGDKWAYRETGDRSERNKYTLPATKVVIDMVADIFKISKTRIEEAYVVAASDENIIVEVSFI